MNKNTMSHRATRQLCRWLLTICILGMTSRSAYAATQRIASFACQGDNLFDDTSVGSVDYTYDFLYALAPTSFGMSNFWYDAPWSMYCPTIDTNVFSHDATTSVLVHALDGHSGASVGASVCIAFADAAGGDCGSVTSSGAAATGYVELDVSDLTAWTDSGNRADYAFVVVTLPLWPSEGNRSGLKGITISTD